MAYTHRFLIHPNDPKQPFFSWFVHSGGEVHVTFENNLIIAGATHPFHIKAFLYNSDAIMCLENLVDAIRRINPDTPIDLELPYLPYARADRVMPGGGGDALGAAVFARRINALGFRDVVIWHPHSNVGPALINNARSWDFLTLFRAHLHAPLWIQRGNKYIITPDLGALKLGESVADAFETPVIRYAKKREAKTGKINGVECLDFASPMFYDGGEAYVLDDIIDGGRTFVEIARSVDKARNAPVAMHLVVTHGIFSNGFDELLHYYSTITVAHSFRAIPEKHRTRIQVIG